MMQAYAFFRLPGKRDYVEVRQKDGGIETLSSYNELSGKRGFVIAPFAISDACPLIIIKPEICRTHAVPESSVHHCCDAVFTREKKEYVEDFNKFHDALVGGTFTKIVLSRSSETKRCSVTSDKDIFLTACNLYPHMFVALVSAPYCGTWLMSTPEILVEGKGDLWHTMALAGTMRDDTATEWSEKNIREQKYVEDYISGRLSRYVSDIRVEGPYTSHAGNLIHLRSDFTFKLGHPEVIGNIIECLHPTPAVCGLPKEEAMQFILDNEHTRRLYYSGFSGMLDKDGGTHLFVSLRCMKMTDDKFCLYAGGGLLDASEAEKEWLETEAKMETMKKCIV